MIFFRLEVAHSILILEAVGHAGGTSQSSSVNTACAVFTTLVSTFEQSVTGLCRLLPITREMKSGKLRIKWQIDKLSAQNAGNEFLLGRQSPDSNDGSISNEEQGSAGEKKKKEMVAVG